MTLASKGVVDHKLASRLVAASGLRHLIVHRYEDIDLDRVLRTVRDHLSDLPAFVRRLRGD